MAEVTNYSEAALSACIDKHDWRCILVSHIGHEPPAADVAKHVAFLERELFDDDISTVAVELLFEMAVHCDGLGGQHSYLVTLIGDGDAQHNERAALSYVLVTMAAAVRQQLIAGQQLLIAAA